MLTKSKPSVIRFVPWLAVAALVISAGTAFATDPGYPEVEIVVQDGTSNTVFAGCSEPTYCMGSTWIASQLTGTVTNAKNTVAWSVWYGWFPIRLYVDGTLVYTQSRNKPMLWNTSKLSAGSHTLVVTAYNSAGVMGASTPLTLTLIK